MKQRIIERAKASVVLRASKLPPYQPHRIYPLQEKQS